MFVETRRALLLRLAVAALVREHRKTQKQPVGAYVKDHRKTQKQSVDACVNDIALGAVAALGSEEKVRHGRLVPRKKAV